MLRFGQFRKKRVVGDWAMESAGPALLTLSQDILSLCNKLAVSPTSSFAIAFSAELVSLSAALAASGGRPSAILTIADKLDLAVNTFGAWQSAEVMHTVDSMTQMLKVLAEALRESVGELAEAEPEFEALARALKAADKAESLEEIRTALDGQKERVARLHETQIRQRSRYSKRLEATVATLASDLAVAMRDSQQDALTGALNRTGFETRFAEAKLKLHDTPCTLVMFDLDGFKLLNDSLGHVAGDSALKSFKEFLNEAVPDAIVSRYGGDEFVLLVRRNAWSLRSDLAKFRTKLPKREIKLESPRGHLTMRLATSYGITEILPSDSMQTAVARADAELYKMKHSFPGEKAA